ncbi:MAG: DUF402 domain-containing protein [Gemmatimonadota bacterium]
MARRVAIHYRRPPDHLKVYDQWVAFERDDVIVTVSDPLQLEEPLLVDGGPGLEAGSIAVWFTFPGVWHDIGRFHLADGTFTGLYANVLTPPELDGSVWHTTDLWLDVWTRPGAAPRLLDLDEFEEGVSAGHIDDATASRARAEADTILEGAAAGTWPPPVVHEWTLERALRELNG